VSDNEHKPGRRDLVSSEAQTRAQGQHLAEQEAAEERARRNANFVQIDRKSMQELRMLIGRSGLAARLLLMLAEKMNRENAIVISFHTLERITGKSRTALHNAIALLKKEQWIQVVKVGTANAYFINNAVFWRGEGKDKQAHFRAAIIASFDEQDERENWEGVKLKHFPVLDPGERLTHTSESLPPPDQSDLDLN